MTVRMLYACAQLLLMAVSVEAFQTALPQSLLHSSPYSGHHSDDTPILVLSAATVTPIGPFCPFRSTESEKLNSPMEEVATAAPQYETSLARLQLDFQMGNTPSKETLLQASEMLHYAVDKWEQLNQNMQSSNDFQSREYAHLTQAHLNATGAASPDDLAASMKWQADCLQAMANDQMPPMPPPGVDVQKLMQAAQEQEQQGGSSPQSSIGNMMATAERLTAKPFKGDEAIFESPVVKQEFEDLCRDHQHLIDFGSNYGTFDPVGKLYFLDEIEKVQDRWDVFFARASLMDMIDSQYKRQVQDFLKAMNMDESTYRQQLKEAHDLMRQEAEQERNMI